MKRRTPVLGAALLAAILLASPALAEDPAPVATPAAPPAAPAPESRAPDPSRGYSTSYVGAVFRPQFCLHGCIQSNRWQNQYLVTGGVEVGDRYFGLAIRYGQERRYDAKDGVMRTAHEVSPDLRGFYTFKVGPLLLTPFLEFTPMVLFGGVTGVHLVVRPGFRMTFLLAKFLDIAFEPFALDVDWYRWERYGSHNVADFSVSLRYSISLGMHYRW